MTSSVTVDATASSLKSSALRQNGVDSAVAPRRVLLVTNIPSPYQIDLFAAIHRRPELNLYVVFCAESELDRQFSPTERLPFPATVLESRRGRFAPKDWHSNPELLPTLSTNMPLDVAVVSGSYFMPSARAARRFMIEHNIPWFYWGENPRKKPGPRWRRRLREAYLRWFLAPAAGVLGIGGLACESYRYLVPPGKPVHNLPYAPNLEPLLKPDAQSSRAAAQLRDDWPIKNPVVVMSSGSLTHRKAPDTLLAAFAQIAPNHPNLCLQFAGDGPLRDRLESEARRLGLADRVRFLGFIEGEALCAAYLSADLFALPTRTHEGWGVVVQEALAAGLPAMLSSRVGCLPDVLAAGAPAREFPPDVVPALATLLEQLAADAPTRERMSRQATHAASQLDCHASARAAVAALTGVIETTHDSSELNPANNHGHSTTESRISR